MRHEEPKPWYYINNIDTIDSPALVIYKDRVEENIRLLVSMTDEVKRLRPHVKTHKTVEATLMQMAAGIHKFKCATIAEAEMLAIAGAPDVLLAYQPLGPKLVRFISLLKKHSATKFSCLTDNFISAKAIGEACVARQLTVPVFIDINVGMNRTGTAPSQVVKLYEDCKSLQGITIRGLHVYDGHLHTRDFEQRTKECDEVFTTVEQIKKHLGDKGFAEPVIIAGGTPTFAIHLKRENIECSPGTFIFWDKGYEELCKEQPFAPAALVITRVISVPSKNKICLDLGHKSIASENLPDKRVHFLNAPELKLIAHSEEHLVVEAPASHSHAPGDVLYGLPFHICPTVALYERAYVIENGEVSTQWKILARDRKIIV
jgi:D-serine deaminase-like pyridoxal phosphate-dependent protein